MPNAPWRLENADEHVFMHRAIPSRGFGRVSPRSGRAHWMLPRDCGFKDSSQAWPNGGGSQRRKERWSRTPVLVQTTSCDSEAGEAADQWHRGQG